MPSFCLHSASVIGLHKDVEGDWFRVLPLSFSNFLPVFILVCLLPLSAPNPLSVFLIDCSRVFLGRPAFCWPRYYNWALSLWCASACKHPRRRFVQGSSTTRRSELWWIGQLCLRSFCTVQNDMCPVDGGSGSEATGLSSSAYVWRRLRWCPLRRWRWKLKRERGHRNPWRHCCSHLLSTCRSSSVVWHCLRRAPPSRGLTSLLQHLRLNNSVRTGKGPRI